MQPNIFSTARELMDRVEAQQGGAIAQAAGMLADAIAGGGLLLAFGSGHSIAGANELCARAGGFIPSKLIREPAGGIYETLEGAGPILMRSVDVRPEDIVFLISNAGRNPLPIEIAQIARQRGAKTVAVTSVTASRGLVSRHHSGKNLFEVVDLAVDTMVPTGDACLRLPGLDAAICGLSTVITALIDQAIVLEAAKLLLARGQTPPFYKSQNIDGGLEYNEALLERYFDRLHV